MKKAILGGFLLIIFVIPVYNVIGAGLVPCGGPGEPACNLCHIFVMLKNIYYFTVYTLVPAIAVLMIVVGGFMYMTAFLGGDSGGLQKANDLFKYVVWGLLIVYGAHLFITLLLTIIGWQWGEWWKICPDFK